MKHSRVAATVAFVSLLTSGVSLAQAPGNAPRPEVPDWAIPGSATHKQVPPPPDFHRESIHQKTPIGIFSAQSDIGAALVSGSASFENGTYTIHSAGYNIWYTRDEFRFLWNKMSGDISLSADIAFPDPNGYGDRKAVLVIRQDLDDDSKQVVVALHGLGMIQLAQRPAKGALTKDREFRVGGRGRPEGKSPDSLVNDIARRVGIQKRGNEFSLFVSLEGEGMTRYGPPIKLEFTEPFYVGIGFSSHLPDVVDSATFSDVVLLNYAGVDEIDTVCRDTTRDAMGRCNQLRFEAEDYTLNHTYKKLMKSLSSDRQRALREEQRAWLKQRDEVCTQEVMSNNVEDPKTYVWGEYDHLIFESCRISQTKQRIESLNNNWTK